MKYNKLNYYSLKKVKCKLIDIIIYKPFFVFSNKNMMINRLYHDIKDIKQYEQFSLDLEELNNKIIYLSFKGADKTLYENENFKLKFQFNERYVSNNFL